jgi:T4 recombination endonuclease VII-like protein
MSAVADAIDALRQAMLDEGQDPDTVEAKLHMAKPAEVNIVGNYADLQRMGAIAQTGVLPTPPGEEDIETDDITEAFVPVESGEETGSGAASPEQVAAAEDGGYDAMTKAELQADLDERGIEYNASATKAELVELAEG